MFKFVLLNNNCLYIGSSKSYRMDICSYQPGNAVRAAGYIYKDGDRWELSGKSLGYDVSFTSHDVEVVNKILEGLEEDDLKIEYRNSVFCKAC